MLIVPIMEGESWRVYTNRLAKLNRVSRRRIVRRLKKLARA